MGNIYSPDGAKSKNVTDFEPETIKQLRFGIYFSDIYIEVF